MHQNPSNLGQPRKPCSPRQYAKIKQCGDKTSPKNCWKHIILCPRRWHDSPHGPQLHHNGTNKSHWSDIRALHAIAGLSGKQQPRNGKVSRVEYGNEHTFRRIVPFSSGSAKPYTRTFFMGSIPKDNEPIVLNEAFHTSTTVMRFVVASATEAELGALFHNCQTAKKFDKPWPTLVIPNLKHPSTATMQRP